MQQVAGVISLLITGVLASTSAMACTVPDVSTWPNDVDGPVFELSDDYPQLGASTPGFLPVSDFKTDWKGYLNEILAYAMAGNIAVDFRVQENEVRTWYHAPWMQRGVNGREYLRGLTRERSSRPYELDPDVGDWFQNWGIGFFNPRAAAALGAVWEDRCDPALERGAGLSFPPGSVSFKLLFTDARPEEVEELTGAPTWTADIHINPLPCNRDERPCERPRQAVEMRFLQMDVAVKDPRAAPTGWVFGTFVYDQTSDAEEPWERLAPISIGWGNDPSAKADDRLAENYINQAFDGRFFGWGRPEGDRWPGRPHLGWQGRVNGPVDNPASSCVSCHASAQYPRSDRYANVPSVSARYSEDEILAVYFRNVPGGSLFDPDVTPGAPFEQAAVVPIPLDYSLQTQLGLEQLCFAWADGDAPFGKTAPKPRVCSDRATAKLRDAAQTLERRAFVSKDGPDPLE